jgi:hypothetical protein
MQKYPKIIIKIERKKIFRYQSKYAKEKNPKRLNARHPLK